jgi:uncharacterized protein (TIGR03435 family)
VDGDRVDIGYSSIAELIQKAYGVKAYQVAGLPWIKKERFDILAKMPAGVAKDQIPEMLKALLAERFQLTLHRQPTEQAVYALIEGKTGAKLTPAMVTDGGPDTPAPAGSELSFNGSVSSWKNGTQRGTRLSTEEGGTLIMTTVNGNQRIEGEAISLPQLAHTLTDFVDRPVVDRTGIAGSYQIQLEIAMADVRRLVRPPGRSAAPDDGVASEPGGGASVFTAVQRLGLRLEPRKEMIETLIVDQAEKTPAKN